MPKAWGKTFIALIPKKNLIASWFLFFELFHFVMFVIRLFPKFLLIASSMFFRILLVVRNAALFLVKTPLIILFLLKKLCILLVVILIAP